MYFKMKNILKSNRYDTSKHTNLDNDWECGENYIFLFKINFFIFLYYFNAFLKPQQLPHFKYLESCQGSIG
jgi:hypothetical protein